MTTIYKIDETAANRLLNAACREAIALIRAGRDSRDVLEVAGAGAELPLTERAG